jgi:C_GCAxxG_C_C family probable redox protein
MYRFEQIKYQVENMSLVDMKHVIPLFSCALAPLRLKFVNYPILERKLMNVKETAKFCFCEGASCSQAILTSFAERYGLNRELAFKLGSGFSGGMGRQGQTCGAVTGGVMVLGLAYGGISEDDIEGRSSASEKTAEFIQKFKDINGTTECNGLIDYDLSDLEQRKEASEKGVFKEVCPLFVESAAQILQEMID